MSNTFVHIDRTGIGRELMNQSGAGSSTPVNVDWHYGDGEMLRTIHCIIKDTADSLAIDVSLDGTPDVAGNFITVATIGTGVTSGIVQISGPFKQIRITKTGTAGTARVIGLL